jgi:hypothetical protein
MDECRTGKYKQHNSKQSHHVTPFKYMRRFHHACFMAILIYDNALNCFNAEPAFLFSGRTGLRCFAQASDARPTSSAQTRKRSSHTGQLRLHRGIANPPSLHAPRQLAITAIAIEQCRLLFHWHPMFIIKEAMMQTLLLEAHDQWVILFYIACSVGAMLWSMRNRG